jgi:hypothetical protein
MKHATCFNCQDRTSGCHSQCEKYLKFRAERDAELEKRKKINTEIGDMYGCKRHRYKKLGFK